MYTSALADSWSFFKNHIFILSALTLPIVIPLEILSAFYQHNFTNEGTALSKEILPISLSILLYPIYSVAVVIYISSVISGNKYTIKELYAFGLQYWLPYLIITILIGIAVIGGLTLFIIPGIIFIVRFSFTEFELILNNMKPIDAMRSSWELSKDHMVTLLLGYAIITVCLFAPSIALSVYLEENTETSYILNAIMNILYAVFNTFYTIYAYRIYDYSKQNNN